METSYDQTGGARIGIFNATWPFATLFANRDGLRLQCFGKTYTFPKGDIYALSRFRGLFSVGLRIEHSTKSIPDFIVFWASITFIDRGLETLQANLQSLGYSIKNNRAEQGGPQ